MGLAARCLPAPSELLVLAAAMKCLLGRGGKGRAPTCPSPHPQPCRGVLAELQGGSWGMEERRGDVCSSPARPTFPHQERSATVALKSKQVNVSCSRRLVFAERKLLPGEMFVCGLSLLFTAADKSCSSAVPSLQSSFQEPQFFFILKSRALPMCV